jgi:hypothetical protein
MLEFVSSLFLCSQESVLPLAPSLVDFDPSDEGDAIGSEGLGSNALAGR